MFFLSSPCVVFAAALPIFVIAGLALASSIQAVNTNRVIAVGEPLCLCTQANCNAKHPKCVWYLNECYNVSEAKYLQEQVDMATARAVEAFLRARSR